MVENDYNYHLKKSPDNQANVVDYALISRERAQKLELLIHLIANSTQSLAVCGPAGIGKTTLLKLLQDHKNDSWLYCAVKGNTELNFEKIQDAMSLALKQDKPDKSAGSLTRTWGQSESRYSKKIILIIDEAGLLVPGLIRKIMQYAVTNPALRVIFALTHDDLYVKNRTDSEIEDCHFIDIPPLSENQCGEFLRHLSTKQRAVPLNSITEDMVETIYRETHGIPGRIIAEAPDLGGFRKTENSLAILVTAVVVLVVIALGIQWFSASEINLKKALTPAVDNREAVVTASPVPSAGKPNEGSLQEKAAILGQPAVVNAVNPSGKPESAPVTVIPPVIDPVANTGQALNDGQDKIAERQVAIDNAHPDIPGHQDSIELLQKNTGLTQVPEGQAAGFSATQSAGEAWFRGQPADNYTLQIMALSKEQSIINVLNKYPSLSRDLKYIKTLSHGKEKFILYYGSFGNADLAKKTRQTLPPEFRHSLLKKISAVNK